MGEIHRSRSVPWFSCFSLEYGLPCGGSLVLSGMHTHTHILMYMYTYVVFNQNCVFLKIEF